MRIIGIRPSTRQFLAAICGTALFLLVLSSVILRSGESLPVYMQFHSHPQIIIDAGHGGIDGGAVGIDNTVEKHINLAISLKLAELLQLNGFEVILTRSTDASIHDPEIEGIARQKRSDMYNRKAVIDANPNALFLSIHQNLFQDPSCQGAQVFYSDNHADSALLAQSIQDQFRESLQQSNSREIKAAGENLFLLYNAQVPAVMVECGFLSNASECMLLQDEEYQKKIACVIDLGLLDFYSQR